MESHMGLYPVFSVTANRMGRPALEALCIVLDFRGRKYNLARLVVLNVQIFLSAS